MIGTAQAFGGRGIRVGAAACLAAMVLAACNGKTCPSPGPRSLPIPEPEVPAARRRAGPAPRTPAHIGVWDVPEGVAPRDWRYIVIHHSATDEGSAKAFDRYHRKVKGWTDLAYHFVIGNGHGTPDGAVEIGPRWKAQRVGAHAGVDLYNRHGIGICLVGNFETSTPTKKQIETLARLLRSLMERFDIPVSRLKRHRDIVSTKCPGKLFPWPVVTSTGAPAE